MEREGKKGEREREEGREGVGEGVRWGEWALIRRGFKLGLLCCLCTVGGYSHWYKTGWDNLYGTEQ